MIFEAHVESYRAQTAKSEVPTSHRIPVRTVTVNLAIAHAIISMFERMPMSLKAPPTNHTWLQIVELMKVSRKYF